MILRKLMIPITIMKYNLNLRVLKNKKLLDPAILMKVNLQVDSKTSGKYADWNNVQSLNINTIDNIDWKTVNSWKYYSHQEVLFHSAFKKFFTT